MATLQSCIDDTHVSSDEVRRKCDALLSDEKSSVKLVGPSDWLRGSTPSFTDVPRTAHVACRQQSLNEAEQEERVRRLKQDETATREEAAARA